MNSVLIRNYKKSDLKIIRSIFNYYAENSYAVYSENKFKKSFVEQIVKNARVLLILQVGEAVAGFGYISPYKPFKNFAKTGVLTYFISEEFTGKGYGRILFDNLIEKGMKSGISNYLAHISSLNEPSLKFHWKLGFEEVGRFKHVADKFGQAVDIIWVQKDYNSNRDTKNTE